MRKDRFWWRFHLITGRDYASPQYGILLWGWTKGSRRHAVKYGVPTLDVWVGRQLITLRLVKHDD